MHIREIDTAVISDVHLGTYGCHEAQYVICGHIHQAQDRIVETKKGNVRYLNSGDWIENLTALEYYNDDWHIYTYDPLQIAHREASFKLDFSEEKIDASVKQKVMQVKVDA